MSTNEEPDLTADELYNPFDRPPGEKRGEKRRRPNEQYLAVVRSGSDNF